MSEQSTVGSEGNSVIPGHARSGGSFPGLQVRIRRDALRPPALPISQVVARDEALAGIIEPTAGSGRIRHILDEHPIDEDVAALATIDFAPGKIGRTATLGAKKFEEGIMPCRKSGYAHHVQGATAEDFVVREQTNHQTSSIAMEAMRISWPGGCHYPDAVLVDHAGRLHVREIKRDERDLRKPRLRANMAMGHDVLRRAGIDYDIVFRTDIFENSRHRRNAWLFASRGFAHVSRRQLQALDRLLERDGSASTWGEITSLLAEGDVVAGAAAGQALVVRRRIEIDLAQRIHADVPVTIHPASTVH